MPIQLTPVTQLLADFVIQLTTAFWGDVPIYISMLGGTLNSATHDMKRLDVRKIRKLSAPQRYGELYFYWREAEQMIASNFPHAQRYGRRLKKRVEGLYEEWFGPLGQTQNAAGPARLY